MWLWKEILSFGRLLLSSVIVGLMAFFVMMAIASIIQGLTSKAHAHGWYPWQCCSGHDCAEIEKWTATPDGGAVVTNRFGTFGLSRAWIVENAVPSQDFDSHLCIRCEKRDEDGQCVAMTPRKKCLFLGGGV